MPRPLCVSANISAALRPLVLCCTSLGVVGVGGAESHLPASFPVPVPRTGLLADGTWSYFLFLCLWFE